MGGALLSLGFAANDGHLRGNGEVNKQPELVLDLEKLAGMDRRQCFLDLAMVIVQQIQPGTLGLVAIGLAALVFRRRGRS